jgi:acetyl-CoA C-acetyltransferase
MNKVCIVAAKRTAIGSFNGIFAKTSAAELGAAVIKSLLDDTGITPDSIDEVIMGQVLSAGNGQCPARQSAIAAGIPVATPAMNINKVCGSGLKAVMLAAQAIMLGDADIIIAGGQENMSLAPHLLSARAGLRLGHGQLADSLLVDGLTDAYQKYHMGMTAENIATKYQISREQQDEFAYFSQQKAHKAQQAGKFIAEIAPVYIKNKGVMLELIVDEYIKGDTTLAQLTKLKPAFKAEGGSVTAGNASGINDGAAAVVVMSLVKAQELGLKPLAIIQAYATAGLEPAFMGIGPVFSTKKILAKTGLTIDKIDLIEANEAFAVQAIAVNQELSLNADKVNVNGGAIALGHPIGASGARILVTLLHEMQRRNTEHALATLCIGGGMGVTLLLNRC